MTDTSLQELSNLAPNQLTTLDKWIFTQVSSYIKGDIVEVASRNGNVSSLLVNNGISLRISEWDKTYAQILRAKFKENPLIKGILRIEPGQEGFETKCSGILGWFDTVILLNLLEDYSREFLIIDNIKKLLSASGRLILVWPSRFALYSDSSEEYKDWKKWNWQQMKLQFGKEYEIQKMSGFIVSTLQSTSLTIHQVPTFRVDYENNTFKSGLYTIAVIKKIKEALSHKILFR